MSQRFFVSTPITQSSLTLEGDEAHHLGRVMRARPGDVVVLFDGGGAEFTGRIMRVGRSSVDLEVIERRDVNRESPVAVTLGVALPKGDRQRFLIEKAVELGVARLVPLETQRGVAQPTAAALERLHRAVIEASKQCGRNRLMDIAAPMSVRDYFDAAPNDAQRLIAHFDAGVHVTETKRTGAAERTGAGVVYFAVGPEGGFSEDEVEQALAAGWRAVSLGPRILRVETAALALAARWVVDGA